MRFFQPLFFLSLFAFGYGQNQKRIDFIKAEAIVQVDPYEKAINGKVVYGLEVIGVVDSISLDAEDMQFTDVFLDGEKIDFNNSGKQFSFKSPQEKGKHFLKLSYLARPKQTVYFLGWDDTIEGNEQIWTQGQGKYTSHWLPSFDDMTEKVEFDLTIHIPPKQTAIANGRLISNTVTGDLQSWKFDMTQPMSSYLAAFVIGNFDKKVIQSTSGVPIELYYEPKDSLKFEPTYRYTKEIFDFLEAEIGVAYPWQNYKQVPVHDFLYAGMENTSCTIFSNTYMIDSIAFVDKNYVNVNAHELAHQWFGNLVTEQSGDHHWLHEGFATYYAYLAEKELFGEDHFYWKLYETAKTLNNLSENGDGEALTNPNANSLTFYEKGAWALVLLRERVGDEAFRLGIQHYLNNYAYQNVTITNFLKEMEQASGQKLSSFRTKWLENEEFPWSDVQKYLAEKSNSLKTYFALYDSLKEYPERFDPLMGMWDSFHSDHLKSEIIKDFAQSLSEPYFMDILSKESTRVRKAMLLSLDSIPQAFKKEFKMVLTEPSYVSQEVALLKLWLAFPEERLEYLDATSSVTGLPNKNVRLLWLTLALVTPDISPDEKQEHYQELNSYTNAVNHFEVRQLAFQYLNQIKALDKQSVLNLINATDHHIWQFRKTSRNLLRKLNKEDDRLREIIASLEQTEKKRIEKILTK